MSFQRIYLLETGLELLTIRFYDLALNEKDKARARKKMQKLYDDRTKEEKVTFEKTGL